MPTLIVHKMQKKKKIWVALLLLFHLATLEP